MKIDDKNQPPILVSACLAGLNTRYDGTAGEVDAVLELVRRGKAIPVCPEQLGGRPTPRLPNEILNGRVVDPEGEDLTEAFVRGAEEGLKLAKLAGCTTAILKSRSPSCGKDRIYDGTFSGTMVDGNGVFAQLLMANGIEVLSDEEIPRIKTTKNEIE